MPAKPQPKKPVKIRRQPIPPGLRFDVLQRAKFRCEACGVSAKEARLEIDHKIPVSQGGTNMLRNLQALCRACNRGKGAKMKRARVAARKRSQQGKTKGEKGKRSRPQ